MSSPTIHGSSAAGREPAAIRVAVTGQPGPEAPVTLAVLATDPIVGAGAVAYLNTQPGLVTLPATSAHEADVILIVDELGSGQAMARMRWVAGRAAQQEKVPRDNRFVVISDQATDAQLRLAAECGLVSVLPRLDCDYGHIIEAIRRLDQGRVELPGVPVRSVLTQLPPPPGGTSGSPAADPDPDPEPEPEPGAGPLAGRGTAVRLSDRERAILRLLADGSTTAEIAARLSYSERTIKNVIQKILVRLQVRNRPHAVAFALRNGLL